MSGDRPRTRPDGCPHSGQRRRQLDRVPESARVRVGSKRTTRTTRVRTDRYPRHPEPAADQLCVPPGTGNAQHVIDPHRRGRQGQQCLVRGRDRRRGDHPIQRRCERELPRKHDGRRALPQGTRRMATRPQLARFLIEFIARCTVRVPPQPDLIVEQSLDDPAHTRQIKRQGPTPPTAPAQPRFRHPAHSPGPSEREPRALPPAGPVPAERRRRPGLDPEAHRSQPGREDPVRSATSRSGAGATSWSRTLVIPGRQGNPPPSRKAERLALSGQAIGVGY